MFNNTSLSPHTGSSTKDFIREYDWKNRLMNYRTLNNIMHVRSSSRNYSIKDEFGSDNLFDFDLLVGRTVHFLKFRNRREVHGVKGLQSIHLAGDLTELQGPVGSLRRAAQAMIKEP